MIGVICLLEMRSSQNILEKELSREDIRFLCDACTDAIGLLIELERFKDATDVIILKNPQNADYLLSEIRTISPCVRIVLILNGTRNQYVSDQIDAFRNDFMVTDIIFEGKGVETNSLAYVIHKGKMTENEMLINNELIEETEKTKVNTNCNIIGIFGATHGAGVTNMVITFAEYFARNGNITKAVDLTGTSSLAFAKNGKAIYLTEKRQNLNEVKATSSFLIYDFGVPFRISPKGDFLGMSEGYSLETISELKQCNLKVCMGFLDDWQIQKVLYFWKDEKWKRLVDRTYVFLFDREPKVLKNKYGHINMFERNDEAFADTVTKLFANGD